MVEEKENDVTPEEKVRASGNSGETFGRMALRFSFVLLVITGISGVLLASVFALTRKKIRDEGKKEVVKGLKQAFPAPDGVEMEYVEVPAPDGGDVVCWEVRIKNGDAAGFVAKGEAQGYSSTVPVLLGVCPNNGSWKIKGLMVLKTEETPGLGENARAKPPLNTWVGKLLGRPDMPERRPVFQSQFSGKPFSMLPEKSPKEICDDPNLGIDAMSGATITSYAVMRAAKAAAKIAEEQVKKAEADGMKFSETACETTCCDN